MVALGVRHRVHARVRRDEQEGNANASSERQAVGTVAEDLRRDVIVEAIGFVIGDDDGAVLPYIVAGDDRLDDARAAMASESWLSE